LKYSDKSSPFRPIITVNNKKQTFTLPLLFYKSEVINKARGHGKQKFIDAIFIQKATKSRVNIVDGQRQKQRNET